MLTEGRLRYGVVNSDGSVTVMSMEDYIGRLQEQDPTVNYREGGRAVGKTTVGEARVSTVFLTINHGWKQDLWFETMVFGYPAAEDWQCRYETVAQAEAGHAWVVERVKEGTLTHDTYPPED